MADVAPNRAFHLWQIGLLLLIAGAIGWSAFVRPSITNKADTIVQNFAQPSTPIAGLSCWRVRGQLLYEHGTPTSVKK